MSARLAETITEDGEVVQTGLTVLDSALVVGLAKAEIDQQISTARAYPRSITRCAHNILSLVTLDDVAAAECIYALPRGGKPISGPSIRMAEIIASQWGNCRVGARVIDVNRSEKYVEAEGVFHDLETNTATKATVRRRIVDKNGRLFNDDMIIVTGNAACSIAKRNAILNAVPKAVWRKPQDMAMAVIKGDVKTLTERRAAALKAFAAFGVTPEQVFAALGIAGEEEITIDHMPTLIGMHAAIKSGEETVETMFRPANASKPFAKVENPLADEPASSGQAAESTGTNTGAQAPETAGAVAAKQDAVEDSAGAQPGAPEESHRQPETAPQQAESPSEQILARLREAAAGGPRKLKFALGKLNVEEIALVTDEDRAELEAAANAGAPAAAPGEG